MSSKIPLKVMELVQKLEAMDSPDFHFLKTTVAKSVFSETDVEQYAQFNHPADQSYGRHLLYESRRLKVFLMCWLPGDFTAIHDHGRTEWGCIVALGDFVHREYHIAKGQLAIKSVDALRKGEVSCLTGDLIHMMGNAGNRNIMSLHIYGSDSYDESLAKRSRIYLPDKKKIITTNGPAFLNSPEENILKTKYFDYIHNNTLLDYLELLKIRSEKIKQRMLNILIRHMIPRENDLMPEELNDMLNNPALFNQN